MDVEFYEKRNGVCPVADFIRVLESKEQAGIRFAVERLGKMGLALRRPFVDYLRDDIYELRVKLEHKQCRILYFIYHRDSFILLHAIIKKADEVADSEIARAIEYKLDYLERHIDR